MIAQGNLALPDRDTKSIVDKQSLIALKALIDRKLASFDESPALEGPNGVSETANDGDSALDKDVEMLG